MSDDRQIALIEVNISEKQKARIKALNDQMPKEGYNKRTFMRGKGGLYGAAGEIIVLEELGGRHKPSWDYDIVVKSVEDLRFCHAGRYAEDKRNYKTLLTPKKRNVVTIEVKSKKVLSPPKMEYANSVARFSAHQDCTHYVFVRVLEDLTKAWICGACTPQWFYKNAKFHAKGDYDASNNFTFRADCFNVSIGTTLDEEGVQNSGNPPFSEKAFLREVWVS